ncbi:hypothetical protein ACOSQ2_032696 [Xanthoceras sorbifolium]|uniref:Sororin C-terminal region domain-containing protein n=1 Tax=Xanthoceras sorbifolium TaxID=99658 RepID=A0ABQ8H4Q8_9ROSI|nr:hypothetical protein JRO89_XS14G0091100 [Xanthoceras sorbifolium]
MEARRKRKALSDCTNTIVNTTTTSISSSSFSIKKPSTKPSIASALRKVLVKDGGITVINSNSKPCSTATTTTNENGSESAAANPSSSIVVASTPRKSSLVSGTGEHEVVEPCSVYSRRTDKRKSKGKEVVGSPAISINATGDNNKEDKVTGPPKSSTVHHKKKKKDDPMHAMPQDFIEKQRAYFAEIDAFELPEEEVETIDQLE